LQSTLKIIAGRYKNKNIEIPSLETTRTTKAIVRGSVFDRLQFRIHDTLFVELFAGSGSMGLEALSRGAKKALFIEKDRACQKILKKNVESISKQDSVIFNGDSFELAEDIADFCTKNDMPTIVYLDPPFSIREGQEDIYDKCIWLIKKLDLPQVVELIIEHMTKTDIQDEIGSFKKIATKKFGATSLSIYDRQINFDKIDQNISENLS